jgi:hypothetical protein
MTRLFVNVYTDKNEARNAELVECLAANKESFDEVVEIHGRPTYREYFEKINEVAQDDDISIVSNLDIVFEIGSFHMINGYLKANEVYALSRWDLKKSGDIVHFDRDDSQDAWCFRGKVTIPNDCDFGTGECGCDNAIADRLEKAGYRVLNPSKDIMTLHIHTSEVRNYTRKDTISPPYLLVKPHHINENPIYRTV